MCKYCDNTTIDSQSISIGATGKNTKMFIRTGGNRPTRIVVNQWDDYFQCDEIIAVYKMKYCPECGRKLIGSN